MNTFISYSQTDFLKKGLEVHDYLSRSLADDDIYIDQKKAKAKIWREENDIKLKNSQLMILIITPGAILSPEVAREVEIAKKDQKEILPCKANECSVDWKNLPWEIGKYDGIRFDIDDIEALKVKLYAEIKKIKNQSAAEPLTTKQSDFKPPRSTLKNNQENTDTIIMTVSSDRTVYPVDSIVYVRVFLNAILIGKTINIAVYDKDGKLLVVKEINPHKYKNKKLAKQGLFETSFVMKGEEWKVGQTFTVKAFHGKAEAEDTFSMAQRTPVIQTDRSAYLWGSDMIVTVIDPDADKDSNKAEFVGDRNDSLLIISSSEGTIYKYRLRETGNSTGIFQGIVGMFGVFDTGAIQGYKLGKKIIKKTQGSGIDDGFIGVKRGGEIVLTYTNKSTSVSVKVYAADFGASVELDQKFYTWTDKAFMAIVAPNFNLNPQKKDVIGNKPENQITISTSKGRIDYYKFIETREDTGIFVAEIVLSGFRNKRIDKIADNLSRFGITKGSGSTDGFIATTSDDYIEVCFHYSQDEIVVGRAKIGWSIGEVSWLKSNYKIGEEARVRVVDPDMNLDPNKIDSFKIKVSSDSDPIGTDIIVYETNEATGIFEGLVKLDGKRTKKDMLKVSYGDDITATYVDKTLPSPYTEKDYLEISGTAMVSDVVIESLKRMSIIQSHIKDKKNNLVNKIKLGDSVDIGAEIKNNQNNKQKYSLIVQIKNEESVVVFNDSVNSIADPQKSLTPTISWTPDAKGNYMIGIFLWKSVDNPSALAESSSLEIIVT